MSDVELTEDEVERVNKIITGIQTDLNRAIDLLDKGDFKGASEAIQDGIGKSNCPLCKRELGVLIADISHNKQVCILEAEQCEDERITLIQKAKELRDDFVPVKTTKRAIREKAKELEKALPNSQKNSRKLDSSTFPLPLPSIFLRRKS